VSHRPGDCEHDGEAGEDRHPRDTLGSASAEHEGDEHADERDHHGRYQQ
jgi:hypothetical protein